MPDTSLSAFELCNEKAAPRLLLLCDHASNLFPASYGDLGLPADALKTHIACDIGAAHLTRVLAARMNAPAILARWSRLLVDLNRGFDDPTVVMKLSDRNVIPGNAKADAAEVAARLKNFHAPYHDEIARRIEEARAAGIVPVIVSMHSFTPVWRGKPRPWQVGVLYDRDARLAKPLMAKLHAAGFTVGDNEPYSGALENDCLYRHGTMNGLPHVLIEIRQDLIGDEAGVAAMAERLVPILKETLQALGPPALYFSRPLQGHAVMDDKLKTELEAAAFRRLVGHLRTRTDVQNIDMMNLAGFCRNCLGDWYREAAAEKGVTLEKDEAREIVYGMPPAEWKKRYQKEASAGAAAKFAKDHKTHS